MNAPLFAPGKDRPEGERKTNDEEGQQNDKAHEGMADHREDLGRMVPQISEPDPSHRQLLCTQNGLSQPHARQDERHLHPRPLIGQGMYQNVVVAYQKGKVTTLIRDDG